MHFRTAGQHVFKDFRAQLLLQGPVFVFQPGQVNTAPQHHPEFVGVDRFAQEIVGPGPDRPQRRLFLALPGNNDDFRGRIQREQFGKRRQPLFGIVRPRGQSQIQQGHIGIAGLELGHGPGPVLRHQHRIFFHQRPFHLGADFFIIVDNQQSWFHEKRQAAEEEGRNQRSAGSGRTNAAGGEAFEAQTTRVGPVLDLGPGGVREPCGASESTAVSDGVIAGVIERNQRSAVGRQTTAAGFGARIYHLLPETLS